LNHKIIFLKNNFNFKFYKFKQQAAQEYHGHHIYTHSIHKQIIEIYMPVICY